MNDRNDSNDDLDDDDLRRELRRPNKGSSSEHDAAVLARAAAVGQGIANRSQRAAAKPVPPRRFLWIASAAAAVLAVVLVVPTFQVDGDDRLRRPDVLVTPAHNARLDQAPDQFDWPYVPGADRYTLVLRDAGASVLWRSAAISEQQLMPDAPTRLLLEAGGTFIWTVEASSSGTPTELGPFQFTVIQ